MPGEYPVYPFRLRRVRRVEAPTFADVRAAEVRIRPLLPPTPLLDGLKLETLQPTGSFKVRGALAALTVLSPGTKVVTASAGNHGLAVAWAAAELGLEATVVVAETASPAKVEALRRFPATLVQHGADYDAAERHALSLEGHYVSSYNDREVIAGAGTLALELADADTIVVPLGGGGLAGGVGLAATARVIGVVAAASPAMQAAVVSGAVVEVELRQTLADGLAGNIEPGSVTVELCARYLDSIVAVTEDEIAEAMRHLVRAHGIVAEGSGAAGLAAIHSGKVEPGDRTVAVVSGRNVTLETLAKVLQNGTRA
jgi:threonine dehydratase